MTTLSWEDALKGEKEKAYFQSALNFVKSERQAGKQIYPQQGDIFNAFKFTPFDKVNVVILGQDPYHGPNQAHGLCFSVQPGIAIPPSLKNIYKEQQSDLGIPIPNHGHLTNWAEQGVFLLNTSLTVEASKPQSHANIGWQEFTDHVIKTINDHRDHVVFLLWGSHAQKKAMMIDPLKHIILKAPHPSPLSAHRGFLGCKHFSKTNDALSKVGKPIINWQL